MGVSTVFLMLLIYAVGNGWALFFPKRSWVVSTRLESLAPVIDFPLLNGINIFCLASQKASPRTVDVFTNLFGGTDSNEGLGLFSISFDWQYIGSM